MPTKKTSDWREKFDEMFGLCNGGDAVYAKVDDDGLSAKQYLKSFIESLLEKKRKEIRGELINKLFINCECEKGNCPNCERLCDLLDSPCLQNKEK